ncbi:citrate/2-methylcitrate synthase [Devosia albogilva]|uniref:citrate synthase (unknown stereospecificity) n=1 Tax=Devosia albogilva TaxID=429726 RepID=A0ABW5QQ10_9HYPH
MAEWLSANEALDLLGTQPQTLYANVSRGRIKAKPDPRDSRRSLYRAEDVRRLAQRGAGRRKQAAVAAEAIRWGEPVLNTAISTIDDGRLLYRGRDAALLSREATLEEVAGLLWGAGSLSLPQPGDASGQGIGAAFEVLARRAALDPPTVGRSPAVLRAEAAGLLADVGVALAGTEPRGAGLYTRLAARWGRSGTADRLRRALVLLADHELNASTFAARVTASTGASLAAALLSGVAALTGPLHGTAALSALGLIEEAERVGPERAVMNRLGQGVPIPAFGHPLYPEGDVRAVELMANLDVPDVCRELAEAGERVTGRAPNIDFALAVLTLSEELPREAPLVLFALGRTVGWLAHALEQVESGELIRPRARYVG